MRYTYKGNSIYKDGNRLGANKKATVIQRCKMHSLRLEKTISFCFKYGRSISNASPITCMKQLSSIQAEFDKLHKQMNKQMSTNCGNSISERTSENKLRGVTAPVIIMDDFAYINTKEEENNG